MSRSRSPSPLRRISSWSNVSKFPGVPSWLVLGLDVDVDGDMSPEGGGLTNSNVCTTSDEYCKAGKKPWCVPGGASAMSLSAGGESLPADKGTLQGVNLAATSAVRGFSGRLRRRSEVESRERMAKCKNPADRLLTHKVHRYSDKRVR